MDLYTFALVLGATGLGVMGVAGVAQHAGAGGAHAAHGAHAGVPAQGLHGGHGLHAGHGHAPGLRARLHAPVPPHAAHQHGLHLPDALAWLVSPRVLFGTLLGLGTAGVVLHGVLGGAPLFVVALALGVAFERLALNTLYNLTLRFASRPALTLEAAVAGEAMAVTAFDASGQGIVQIEVDGQVVQVLGTLSAAERALGHRVRAGETLRVEEVDAERNRCRVSLL